MMNQSSQARDDKSWESWKGVVPVTFVGDKTVTSYFSKKNCVQFEWVYGESAEDQQWQSYSRGGSELVDNLVVRGPQTGKQQLEAKIQGDLRLHLSPSFLKRVSRNDLKDFSKEMLDHIFSEQSEVDLGEYCLEPGRVYWAWVEKESYWLPPDPKTHEPSRHENTVLHVSDVEPKEGVKLAPLTPSTGSVTY